MIKKEISKKDINKYNHDNIFVSEYLTFKDYSVKKVKRFLYVE